MSRKRLLKRPAALAAAALMGAACATAGGAAMAQMGQADDEALMLYHQSIYAAAECEGHNFYQGSAYDEDWNGASAQAAQSAQAKMAEVIGQKAGYRMRPDNQLVLIEEAKDAARKLIADEGCQGSNVQTLIGLFESDLKPAL